MVTQIITMRGVFSRNEYVIFTNRPVGVEVNANVFIETCSTSVKVSNVSLSNARSRRIIADYCVFNSMK